jgi:hypothetical protein
MQHLQKDNYFLYAGKKVTSPRCMTLIESAKQRLLPKSRVSLLSVLDNSTKQATNSSPNELCATAQLVGRSNCRNQHSLPGQVHLGFVLDKAELGHVFLRVPLFPPVDTAEQYSLKDGQ